MANETQDFNIKVVTTADTTGLRQTSAEMKALKEESLTVDAATLAARKASLAGAFAPIPGGLLAGGQTFEDEMAGATIKTEELAVAGSLAGVNLGKARQEALVLARELATGGNVARTLGSLLGALGPAITIAGIGGLVVYEQIKKMREESEKLVSETAKLGDEFEKSAVAAQNLVTGSRTGDDISKVAQSVLPELEKLHAEANKLNEQTITGVQKALEDLREGIIQMSPQVTQDMREWAHHNTIPLRDPHKQAEDNAEFADHEAVHRIERAKDFRRQFEDLKKLPIEDSVDRLTNKIKEQEALQNNLKKDGEDYARSWLAAQTIIDRDKGDIAEIVKYHKQLSDKTQKYIETADPQVQAILKNEKAMFEARSQGRGQDAAAFERTAQALHRGATPTQEAELSKIYGAPEIVEALRQLAADKRSLIELWQ